MRACSLVVDEPDRAHRAPDVLGVDVGAQRARLDARGEQLRDRRDDLRRASRRRCPTRPRPATAARPSCPSWRRVGDEALHPQLQRDVRRVLGEQLGGGLVEVRRPRRGRRPRPARRGWGSGGRACRSRRRRPWPRRPARRRCRAAANSSVAAVSSFSRLRMASARLVMVMMKRRVPPVRCYIGPTGGFLRFDSRRHATDVQSLVHNRLIEGLRAGLGRGRARARRPGGRDGAQRRHADPARRGLRRQRPRPPARRQRQGGDRRRGQAGARALRPPRRRRQQRRLRALRRDRGAHRGAGARSRSRRTCSARCGSRRPRSRSCARRARATSSRSRRSAA